MFIIKFNKLINLLKKDKLEENYKFATKLLNEYPYRPELYVKTAKICFELNKLTETKKILTKLIMLKNWYKKNIVKEILEITNWKLLYSNKYFCKEPQFSSDGEKIVFVCAKRDTNNDGVINNYDCGGIYITDRNANKVECIVEDKYYNSSPVFSPDNRYLCYLSAREDTNKDGIIDYRDMFGLYLFDLEKGEEKLIVENIYSPKHPMFSPDGKKIVFSCWKTLSSKSSIYEIDLKTNSVKNLVSENYESIFPRYSQDGRYLLYVSFRYKNDVSAGPMHNSGIYLKDLVKNEEIEIVPSKHINSFPIFSHDAKKIAFLSKRRDTNNDGVIDSLDNDGAYIFDLEKKKEYCIHSDEYYNKFLNFTFDDKYIVFLSTSYGYKNVKRNYFKYKGIYICNIKSGKVRQIVSDKYYGCSWPEVSPKRYEVIYTSFMKDTLRGLYIAQLFDIPTKDEIINIINKNL
ncbi:MAG: TolB family protein [Endomicrobiia bacterium]